MELLASYVSAGLPPDRFWEITPRLYFSEMKGVRHRLEREMDDRSQLAWQTAVLMRADKMPKLETLLSSHVPPPPLTTDEIFAQLKSMKSGLPKKRWSEWLQQ